MHAIIQRELDKAIKILSSINCKYAIEDPNGEIIGELRIEAKTKQRKPCKYPPAALSNYIRPFVQNLPEGIVTFIPYDQFERNDLQRSVCAMANKRWGKHTYTTHMLSDGLEMYKYKVQNEQQNII